MTINTTQVSVTLPPLGEAVTEATITRWLVTVGDTVDAEQPLLEVATDKVDTEVPSPHAGIVTEILVDEDGVIAVGAPLALITLAAPPQTPTPADAAPSPAADAAHTPGSDDAADTEAPIETRSPTASDPSLDNNRPELASHTATPAESGCGAIPDDGQTRSATKKLPRIRQVIAARMMDSLRSTAQLTTVVEIDVTAISTLRAATKARFVEHTGVKLSFLPFFAKAAVDALAAHPIISATPNAECTEITFHDGVNLGMAVDSPKGLLVPVIHGAHRLSIPELAVQIASLADKVRTGTISPDALTGGTFTVTNTGSRGALFDTPILNAPQSAILGTGAVVERVVPQRDPLGQFSIVVRAMVFFALTYDHRVVDGADAARFLEDVKHRLEAGFTTDDVLASSAMHP